MSIISAFAKLGIENAFGARRICTSSTALVRITPVLFAEPLKKKKKLDPAIIKQREERKKKKLEKAIRRLERNARQLKPIDEIEVPLELIDEKEKRTRSAINLSPEVQEQRALLLKKWSQYKLEQKTADFQAIDRLQYIQQKALDELRKESEELYQEAIQPDVQLLPFKARGPSKTPPIKNYESPDGEYIDITKKWE